MRPPRLINAEEIRAAISFKDLIEPVADAFRISSAKGAANGFILMLPTGDASEADAFVKTGVLKDHDVYIVKVAPWFAKNVADGLPQGGIVAVFDSHTGHTLAVLSDEHYLSDIRTAAAGALAARQFAPKDVDTVAILGTGVQAYLQALAVFGERPCRRMLVWGRDGRKAKALAMRLRAELPGVECEWVGNVESAVRQSDVVVTATLAREPLVRGAWLRPGQLVIAVGADDPSKCELDVDTLMTATVFVDEIKATAANGDIFHALQSGRQLSDLVDAEIGDVLLGRHPGRTTGEEVIVAKFVGLGAQDVVAAEQVMRKMKLIATP